MARLEYAHFQQWPYRTLCRRIILADGEEAKASRDLVAERMKTIAELNHHIR